MLVGCVVSVAFGIRDDEYPFKTIGRHSLEYLLAIEYPKTVFICDGRHSALHVSEDAVARYIRLHNSSGGFFDLRIGLRWVRSISHCSHECHRLKCKAAEFPESGPDTRVSDAELNWTPNEMDG